MCVNWLTLL
jgi:translocation protein SEC66